jgi:hypothetical protein
MMAVMQRGYDMSNRRALEGMHAQDRMADDWCDYALGVQKRYDPNTGQLYKTDSNYSYDWVNDDGKTHRLSDDINFNPNGLGTGHWTLTQNDSYSFGGVISCERQDSLLDFQPSRFLQQSEPHRASKQRKRLAKHITGRQLARNGKALFPAASRKEETARLSVLMS